MPDSAPDFEFADDGEDVDDGPELTDQVFEVAAQIDAINAIKDDRKRLKAAKAWAAELDGGGG